MAEAPIRNIIRTPDIITPAKEDTILIKKMPVLKKEKQDRQKKTKCARSLSLPGTTKSDKGDEKCKKIPQQKGNHPSKVLEAFRDTKQKTGDEKPKSPKKKQLAKKNQDSKGEETPKSPGKKQLSKKTQEPKGEETPQSPKKKQLAKKAQKPKGEESSKSHKKTELVKKNKKDVERKKQSVKELKENKPITRSHITRSRKK